jgi:uncharacterized protein (TIGR03067 family)
MLAIGCSRQDTSGEKGAPPAKESQGGAQQDRDELQGTWKFVSMGGSGKTRPSEFIADMKVTIVGQQWTLTKGGTVLEQATLTADPSKQPKTIDMKFTQGESKGQISLCIYEVTGDTLRIAISIGAVHPTEIANRAGLRQDLWEMRRE